MDALIGAIEEGHAYADGCDRLTLRLNRERQGNCERPPR